MPRYCQIMCASGSTPSNQQEKDSYLLLQKGERHHHHSNSFPGDFPFASDLSSRRELPPTLILKRASVGKLAKGGCAIFEEAGVKLTQDVGGCRQKGGWREFSLKSPSGKRWEEAAEYEERQEMLRRRPRSQSLRYDSRRVPQLPINAAEDDSYDDDEEEWAVYRRSGYISVTPRGSEDQLCRNSAFYIGRSLSMRDPAMGVVMECAACDAALHGVSAGHGGNRLLCSCSCCAASRAPNQQAHVSKKKRGGILRACRRLLGLVRKRPSSALR